MTALAQILQAKLLNRHLALQHEKDQYDQDHHQQEEELRRDLDFQHIKAPEAEGKKKRKAAQRQHSDQEGDEYPELAPLRLESK